MIIRQPNSSDWKTFAALADAEGWRVPHTEMKLFQGSWSKNAYVLDDGGFCALVTAVAYEKSAWIGNLIVPCRLQGKGYGSFLFKRVLNELGRSGIQSVWLTASVQGRGIYEKEGFIEADSILRWVLTKPSTNVESSAVDCCCSEQLFHADRSAWNEIRKPLTDHLRYSGRAFAARDSIALLQKGQDVQIAGPWYSLQNTQKSDQELMILMLASAEPAVPFVVDSFASSTLPAICKAAGFQLTGKTSLMVYGETAAVDMQKMMSLASLGSFG